MNDITGDTGFFTPSVAPTLICTCNHPQKEPQPFWVNCYMHRPQSVTWLATIGIDRAEMQKVFGAPVEEQDIDKIIDYLIATY
jgi:hypothetical protein